MKTYRTIARQTSLLFLAFVLTSVFGGTMSACKEFDFQNAIRKYAQTKCIKAVDCQLQLAELTPFKWDRLYVFRPGVIAGDANRQLGQNVFTDSLEFVNRFVFFDGEVVVHFETHPISLDRLPDGTVMFIRSKPVKDFSTFEPKQPLLLNQVQYSWGETYEIGPIEKLK